MVFIHLLLNSNKVVFVNSVLHSKMENVSCEINKELLSFFLERRGAEYLKRSYPDMELEYKQTLYNIVKYVSDTYASILILAHEKNNITLENFNNLKFSKEIFLALICPIEYTLYESKMFDVANINQVFIWQSFYKLLILLIFKHYAIDIKIVVEFIQDTNFDCDVLCIPDENKC